jgi:hypothetical protein
MLKNQLVSLNTFVQKELKHSLRLAEVAHAKENGSNANERKQFKDWDDCTDTSWYVWPTNFCCPFLVV